MKKTLIYVLIAFMLLSLTGCAQSAHATQINIGTLKGSTGMGMVALMGEDYAAYHITLASAPDEITAAFISGELDVASVPINLASVLYNKLEGDVEMLAVNTLGVLYILENGESIQNVADLAGKTIYATGQGATPEYILQYLLSKNGIAEQVRVEYMSEHSELAAELASGKASFGMLPEPNVTAALAQNQELRIALDLTKEWNAVCETPLVQGCLIVRKSFLDKNEKAVETFLSDYKASTVFVNEHHEKASLLIESYGIMAKAALAKQTIKRSNIVCLQGADMKTAAKGMLEVLYSANPKSVGGKLPADDFYYGA